MGRMNLSQRSYSRILCSAKNSYEYLFQNSGPEGHKDCPSFALQRTISIRKLDSLLFYVYPRITFR